MSTAIGPADTTGTRSGFLRTVRAYLALTKARIIEQLLVVTVPAMMLAERSVPSLWLVLAVLAGAASFVLAYALHLATAAPVAPTSGAPVWVPEGRAACPSSGHRDG